MPVRYYKPAATAWNTASSWASSVGGVDNAGVPTAADDVIFNNSSGNCSVITTAGVCRSLDFGTGGTRYTGTISGNVAINIGTTTAGVGNLALRISGGCTWTLTGTISLISTSATQQTITSDGKTITSAITVNGAGGSWILQDPLNTTGNLTLTTGTINTNSQSVTALAVVNSGTAVRTLTMGSSAFTLSTTGAAWNTRFSNLTITTNTAVVTCTGAGASITLALTTTGTFSYNGTSFVMSGSGSCVVSITSGCIVTVANFTRTGTAIKTDELSLGGDFIVSGNLTLSANSATNRLLVKSGLIGTSRTITCNGTIIINQCVRFRDITGAGSASWNLSGGAVGGGTASLTSDNKGNTGITFTSASTQTFAGGTFSWSNIAAWTTRVPLAQDDVIIATTTAGTLTADMPELGNNIDFTGFTRTFSNPNAQTSQVFGNFTLASAMVFTGGSTSIISFIGRTTQNLTSNGIIVGGGFSTGAPSTNLVLQDAFSNNTTIISAIDATLGTFDTNDKSVTLSGGMRVQGGTFELGSSVITFTGGATPCTYTAGTINGANSTIAFTDSSALARTFNGGSQQWGSLTYTSALGSGSLTITGSNIWNGIFVVGPGRQIIFTSGATQTFVNPPQFLGQENGYLYLTGDPANYASVPDIAAYTGAGIMRGVVRVAYDDWTPSGITTILAHTAGSPQAGWQFNVLNTGLLRLQVSSDGITNQVNTSSSAPSLTDGTTYWLGFEYNTSTGALTFYKAADTGNNTHPTLWSGWTQISTSTVTAVVPFNSSARLTVGNSDAGATPVLGGKVYCARFYTNTTTLQFEGDFTRSVRSSGWTDSGKTQFVEISANAATVTYNGPGITGDGRVTINSVTPASAAILAGQSLFVSVNRGLLVKDITSSPQGHLYALESVDVSGNTGVTFTPFGWGLMV